MKWKPALCSRVLPLLAALLLAACTDATRQQPRPQATVSGETPPTSPEEAKTQCWMRYENKSAPRDLDTRMALVDKCIEEKMKQLPRAQ
jgi:outer membrane biogenesis lipoprotein LolB